MENMNGHSFYFLFILRCLSNDAVFPSFTLFHSLAPFSFPLN